MASKQTTNIGSYVQRMKKAVTLNLLVQLSSNLGLGFAAYFFKIHGVELYKIILIWAISPLASLPVVFFSNNWDIKRYMRYGLLAFTGMALSLLFFNQYSFLLFGIFYGLALGFFWVSFNYTFFLKSANDGHAKDSSIYFILGPLVGIVLPPLGALIIGSLGYRALFFITVLLSLLPLLYVRGKDFDFHLKQTFREADKAFAGLRLITFFDAALHFFQSNFLAIYALLFLKTEYQVGGLLSYLALASLIVSFFLSHVSDKSKRRVEILYPLLITMSVLILIVPAFKSLAALIPLIGVYSILDNLSLPIRFAVPMDVVQMDIGFWRASEFYGNVGRTVVFAVASLLLYEGSRWTAFLVFAVMTFAFPFIISWKINGLRKSASI
jgi:hypothetical protein